MPRRRNGCRCCWKRSGSRLSNGRRPCYNYGMDEFITKLPLVADADRVMQDLITILEGSCDWGTTNQIGLRCRPGAEDPWRDACGSLVRQGVQIARESDFTEWVPGIPDHTRSVLEELARSENKVLGRVRFMRAMPKQGLSMHVDHERRYHLVLRTNPSAIFGECFSDRDYRCIGYHIPRDNHWYRVNTEREHFIYNGGWEPRIHLVVDPIN